MPALERRLSRASSGMIMMAGSRSGSPLMIMREKSGSLGKDLFLFSPSLNPPLPFNKLLNCSNSHDELERQTRHWFVASSQKGTYVMRCLVLINDPSNAPMLALKKSRLMAA